MEAIFYKQFEWKQPQLFVYEILGTEAELAQYELLKGSFLRHSIKGHPLYFTRKYCGNIRPFVFWPKKKDYFIEYKEILSLEMPFINLRNNLWTIIDKSISKDPRPGKFEQLWSINRKSYDNFNDSLDQLDQYLKEKLFETLIACQIPIAPHTSMEEAELEELFNELDEAYKEIADELRSQAFEEEIYRQGREEIASWGEVGYWNMD
jgi:hypothetical protein